MPPTLLLPVPAEPLPQMAAQPDFPQHGIPRVSHRCGGQLSGLAVVSGRERCGGGGNVVVCVDVYVCGVVVVVCWEAWGGLVQRNAGERWNAVGCP